MGELEKAEKKKFFIHMVHCWIFPFGQSNIGYTFAFWGRWCEAVCLCFIFRCFSAFSFLKAQHTFLKSRLDGRAESIDMKHGAIIDKKFSRQYAVPSI